MKACSMVFCALIAVTSFVLPTAKAAGPAENVQESIVVSIDRLAAEQAELGEKIAAIETEQRKLMGEKLWVNYVNGNCPGMNCDMQGKFVSTAKALETQKMIHKARLIDAVREREAFRTVLNETTRKPEVVVSMKPAAKKMRSVAAVQKPMARKPPIGIKLRTAAK
ncbi:MAG TPA: hypothetical protein VM432_07155 [Bdellovibrionales bacterium]|jgi:hypothetical protein|nr:hypothetical protein [Bdellovibrionales bacterium]